jgi:UDP-glucuronate decarboxylase
LEKIIIYLFDKYNGGLPMKRVLVTGGAGFLGSHLCQRLIDEGNHVICMDNFYTGEKGNINHLLKHPHFELIEHDVISPYDIPVDEIFNLACPASPQHYQKDPVYTTKTSFFGAIHALENAKKYNAKVLQASTSEVYGDPELHPQHESYRGSVNPIGIRSCYDEGKRVAESLFFDYQRMYGVKIKVMRIFNTYGPNMQLDDGRVVTNFIDQALKNHDITIYGDGSQTRSFCYVDDLIDGMMRLMKSRDEFYGPVNIGNPYEFDMIELANLVLELTRSKSKIKFSPLPQDDPMQRKPVIDLAEKELNWIPKVHLREGLSYTIQHYQSYQENNGEKKS